MPGDCINKTSNVDGGSLLTRVGKVEKLSNMSLIKVLDFFISFDKMFV